MFHINDIREDMKQFIKLSSLDSIRNQIDCVAKDSGTFIKRDEYLSRLQTIICEVNAKISDKATNSYVKKLHAEQLRVMNNEF